MSTQQFKTKGGVTTFPLHKVGRYLTGVKGPSGYGSKSTAEQVAANWNGAGKVAIITGASSGLGVEAARVLALRGADVCLAVRDLQKGQKVVDSLTSKYPATAGRFTVMECDVSSIPSVATFVTNFKATGKPLNILMCNAGVMACPFTLSKDGVELQFATNHLGHFYLTNELLDLMAKTAESSKVQGRIVSVSSSGHHTVQSSEVLKGIKTIDDINNEKNYAPWTGYGFSKLCQVLYTRLLQQRIDSQGLNIAAASLHPGFIITELQRHQGVLNVVLNFFRPVLLKSLGQGAATQVYLATAPQIDGGEYYLDVNVAPTTPNAHDVELAERLWKVSDDICRDILAKQKA